MHKNGDTQRQSAEDIIPLDDDPEFATSDRPPSDWHAPRPRVEAPATPAIFQAFRDIAYTQAGISLRDGKEALVSARLVRRMRDLGLGSESEYLDYLKGDQSGEEMVKFLDAISTNFTSFYRGRSRTSTCSTRRPASTSTRAAADSVSGAPPRRAGGAVHHRPHPGQRLRGLPRRLQDPRHRHLHPGPRARAQGPLHRATDRACPARAQGALVHPPGRARRGRGPLRGVPGPAQQAGVQAPQSGHAAVPHDGAPRRDHVLQCDDSTSTPPFARGSSPRRSGSSRRGAPDDWTLRDAQWHPDWPPGLFDPPSTGRPEHDASGCRDGGHADRR